MSGNSRVLPSLDQLRELNDEAVIGRINAIITDVETQNTPGPGGAMLAMVRAQHLTAELVRREQDRQAKVMAEQTEEVKKYTVMIANMTIAVALLSFVSMAATLWPLVHAHCPQ